MNKPEKVELPEWVSDDDRAIYDQMISMGRLQIGKEIGKNEDYLLHLSAMITLKQLKGMTIALGSDEVAELKRVHQENFARDTTFETPPSDFYASALALMEPYLPTEVEKEINEINNLTSNLVIEDKKTSNIEDEAPDADIKENWVKLIEPVERPEPEPIEATP